MACAQESYTLIAPRIPPIPETVRTAVRPYTGHRNLSGR